MTANLMIDASTPSRGRSVAWPPFERKLADALEKLDEDQCLIVLVKHSNRFVQFAAQGSHGMRIETTSNSYLAKPDKLNGRQVATLLGAGWSRPTGSPTESTPENDPDGSPNFFVEFPIPVPFEAVASLCVRTFADILGVPHPGALEYSAFEIEGKDFALPELGLRLAKSASPAKGRKSVSKALLDALKEITGLKNLNFDRDGDIAIPYGSALTFVRLIDEPPYVHIYSPILREVEEDADILGRLNDMNAREPLMRFMLRNETVYATAALCAAPFVSEHLTQAFTHFCAVADGVDSLLQEEFGGKTAFAEPMQSSMKH